MFIEAVVSSTIITSSGLGLPALAAAVEIAAMSIVRMPTMRAKIIGIVAVWRTTMALALSGPVQDTPVTATQRRIG